MTPQIMAVQASFDSDMFEEEEVRGWVKEVLGAVEWLAEEENWEECIHDCGFEVREGVVEES